MKPNRRRRRRLEARMRSSKDRAGIPTTSLLATFPRMCCLVGVDVVRTSSYKVKEGWMRVNGGAQGCTYAKMSLCIDIYK